MGIIDILVKNAGIIKRIPMLEMLAADFHQVVDVDLNAPFIVVKACQKMLTKNICSEFGAYNIQRNGIGPGCIETHQTAPLREKLPDGSIIPSAPS